jgi:hypothetical protein
MFSNNYFIDRETEERWTDFGPGFWALLLCLPFTVTSTQGDFIFFAVVGFESRALCFLGSTLPLSHTLSPSCFIFK